MFTFERTTGNDSILLPQQGVNHPPVEQRSPAASRARSVEKRANTTGLPDKLKAGIEHLSGLAMDDVRVHYNSDKPAKIRALAFAQGTEIHVGKGQEKCLAHEAWHVVQQKQGRVRPSGLALGSVHVNGDQALENEAELMGSRARNWNQGVKSLDSSVAASENPVHKWPGILRAFNNDNRESHDTNTMPVQRMPQAEFREIQGRWTQEDVEKWIEESDDSGHGHTYKHIAASPGYLMERLGTGNTGGRPASSFWTDKAYKKIAEILNSEKQKIIEWIDSGNGGLVVSCNVNGLEVVSYDQASSGKGKYEVSAGAVTVRLVLSRRNPATRGAPVQFCLVTAYPELDHSNTQKKPTRGQKKHQKKTEKKLKRNVENLLYGKNK